MNSGARCSALGLVCVNKFYEASVNCHKYLGQHKYIRYISNLWANKTEIHINAINFVKSAFL